MCAHRSLGPILPLRPDVEHKVKNRHMTMTRRRKKRKRRTKGKEKGTRKRTRRMKITTTMRTGRANVWTRP
jgi:hypothetical protein